MDCKTYLNILDKVDSLYIITSVVRQCVLRCKYCYVINPRANGKIDLIRDDVLEAVIREGFKTRHKRVTFEWTGGEALLGGIPLFKKIIEYQNKFRCDEKKFENVIQSSGALYDERLYDYLIESGFHISFTIDGPPNVHNDQRPTNDGNDSLETVLRSYRYIAARTDYGGALCTLTRKSVKEGAGIEKFYLDNGITWWFSNPYVYDADKFVKDEDYAISSENYFEYFKSQFDRWILSGAKYVPCHVDYIVRSLAGQARAGKCTNTGICLTNFINISPLGDATICSKFMGNGLFKLGNILNNTIKYMLSADNPTMSDCIKQRVTAIKRCLRAKCAYIKVCYAGCPYGSYLNGKLDISRRDILCSGKKMLFKYIEGKLCDNDIRTMNNYRKGDTDEGEKKRRHGSTDCTEGKTSQCGYH